MSYYNDYNWGNCNNPCNGTSGWGVGLSAIVGGALGYWAGRSANQLPRGAVAYGASYGPTVLSQGHCRTCYQQGVQAGQTMAGLDYIGNQVAANASLTREATTQLAGKMQAQFAAIQNRFEALNQQKIADQAAQIAALRTQNIVGLNAAATNAQLVSLNDKISSIVTNCGVRAYPGCPPPTCSCVNQ